MKYADPDKIYRHEFTVPDSAIDARGHVNNVVYVQWMQDVAALHSRDSGSTAATDAAGGAWVVRSHKVEYRNAAFAGDEIVATTWVVDFRRALSLRRYRFERRSDGAVVATGETDWVFVDAASGRPRRIPEEVMRALPTAANERES